MLTISPGLLVWTLITFALALFILWRYVFGPVQRIIDERRARVQESLDTADATRQEATKLLEEKELKPEQLPAVLFSDGSVMAEAGPDALAARVGLRR